MSSSDGEDDSGFGNMFPEPPRPKTPPPTFSTYNRPATVPAADWSALSIRLVGEHPLWGQHLWNAARVFADFLLENEAEFLRGKRVLELGAAGALPGVIAALSGAKKTVITDYPDRVLVDNMQFNVNVNVPEAARADVTVTGHLWGSDVSPLLACLDAPNERFDTLILSDLVFNHSQHTHLLRSVAQTTTPASQILVFYTHHRPRHAAADLDFFRLAGEQGWECEEIVTRWTGVMFEADAHLGADEMRGTVHGWRCRRRPASAGAEAQAESPQP